MIRQICSKIGSVVLAVGSDVLLGRAVVAVSVLIYGIYKPTDLLISSPQVLSLRLYGHLVLNFFVQQSSRPSPFSIAIRDTMPLTLPSPSSTSSISIANEDSTQSFQKCLIIYLQPDFAVRRIIIRLCSGRVVSPRQ